MKVKLLISTTIITVAFALLFGTTWTSAVNGDRNSVGPTLNKSSTVAVSGSLEVANLNWQTVVNNGFAIPDGNNLFSSYSQPSVNANGMVVFRARSTRGGQRNSGIYMRESFKGAIHKIADIDTVVPYPNNMNAEFLEFVAIPRIAHNSDNIVFAGLHKPVYRYFLPDGTETRAGTAGIYAMLGSDFLFTGESKLGNIPDFEHFMVTDTKNVPFDIFPGASAITEDGTIVFKGNFNEDGIGKTGIFFRNLLNTPGGGTTKTQVIATSDTEIPDLPPHLGYKMITFDSTAPPSVAKNTAVFLALDNEQDPHYGGIYSAPIAMPGTLTKVIGIGETVPGVDVPELTRIGEGISYDGQYLGFWGAWGEETKTVRLYCPEDGNPDIINYCNGVDPESVYDNQTQRWYQEKEVPLNQGFFVYDAVSNFGYLAAKTEGGFNDFEFWNYSGKVPGTEPDIDAEPPRWRSASFCAVSGGAIVFKARTGELGKNNEYVNPIDGLYLGEPMVESGLLVVAETGMDGAFFDPLLTPGTLPVTEVGIEREGLRGRRLAISVKMANEENDWGGIYLANFTGRTVTNVLDKNTLDRTKMIKDLRRPNSKFE